MKIKLWTALVLVSANINLTQPTFAQKIQFSTNSDSTLLYYDEGWRQVLDYGHFSRSEKAYRTMYNLDSDFLVGASLLARITPDPAERKRLFETIKKEMDNVEGDEAQLLKLFVNLTELYILREENRTEEIAIHGKKTVQMGEDVLGYLARKYPDDLFHKSEFIEFLHANHGAQVALDSLHYHFKNPPPFMLGYSAQLLSELQEFDRALDIAKKLEVILAKVEAPYVNMVYAKIYKEQGEIEKALEQLGIALKIDPGHILADRMKSELIDK